jgi:hypothetical protein
MGKDTRESVREITSGLGEITHTLAHRRLNTTQSESSKLLSFSSLSLFKGNVKSG